MRVTLYSRPGCHLCDVARATIESQRARTPFELVEIDIETNERLELDYGIRIPVVEIDGVEAFEVEVDPRELERLVTA